MWVCSLIYYTTVNDIDNNSKELTISLPFACNEDFTKLFNYITTTKFKSTIGKKLNDWLDAWKMLPESEQERYLNLGNTSPRFNIHQNTSSGLIHLDFIDLTYYTE